MQNKTKRRRMERHACVTPQPKQTHKLTPQTCVVWVPDVPGYAANFGPGIFQVASHPDFAYPRRPPKVLHLWPPKLLHPGHRILMS
jgi:hypothetical protein